MATVTVSFTLDDQADREVAQWLARLPRRQKSAAIREALRGHLKRQRVTLDDVYQAVREIDRKLTTGAVVAEVSGASKAIDADEPPDVAAALDNLGL
jgi:predicted transcriptional regulator